ncbi:glycosyltransferase family 4 protein [Acidocella sp.]|uniref:glycosyltransferase family 4 protein n=1 Tax=Acidocella sp. TaxID=50710 RepID=UPI00262888AA|nr:glycosyltransferase family 4 protein [Acidocella sp.]
MIVFVTDELPKPGTTGHMAFNFAVLDWLRASGFQVRVLVTGEPHPWPVSSYRLFPVSGPHVLQAGRFLLPRGPVSALRILGRALRRLIPGTLTRRLRKQGLETAASLGHFPTKPDLRWCARAIARLTPHAVLIDTIFSAPLLAEPELASLNSIILTHDIFHRRAQVLRAVGYQIEPASLTREAEAALLAKARALAAIQPSDAAILRDMCPPPQTVLTAPMPAQPCPRPRLVQRIPGRLVFVGSASLPNLDGLRWFFTEIWPHLEGTGITLDLVGECGLGLRLLLAGVTVRGPVAQLAPILHRAQLAIAPVRVGSGLKVKLLEYARHGLYTIATPEALEGFTQDPTAPFIAAATPTAFAQAIIRNVATPPAPGAALTYCTQHYGREASFQALRQALDEQTPAPQPGLRSLPL